MSRPIEFPDTDLDRAIAAARDEDVPRETVEAAAERVRARLAAEPYVSHESHVSHDADPNHRPIESCEDYQSLLPAYLAGELTEARTLLVEEHSRHCLACRKALIAARTQTTTTAQPASHPAARSAAQAAARPAARPAAQAAQPRRSSRRMAPRALALAAALALAVVTGGLLLLTGAISFGPPAVMAEIADIEGTLLRPGDESTRLAAGDALHENERVRTAKDSGAVLTLTDGTRIEMSARAELALDRGWRGTTIQMDGGRIIVEAAEQRNGRLYVSTDDCLVSVVGTVFSVNSGLKGSRVSVLEGEVRVARGGTTDVLKPGDQVTTNAALGPMPLAREISWSRDSERYRALLAELDELSHVLATRIPRPDLRYTSELLPRVPADTVAYLAAPNLSKTLDEAYRLIQEQLETSPQMQTIWQQMVVAPGYEPYIEALITQVSDLGGYLGDEVTVALPSSTFATQEGQAGPVILAQVVRPGFEAFLGQEIDRINSEAGHSVLRLVVADEPAPAAGPGLLVWTDGVYLAASPRATTLDATRAAVASGSSGFAGTPFHRRLADSYAEGVEWLIAADASSLITSHASAAPDEVRKVGIDSLQHILIERRSLGDHTETGVQVSFDGERRGVFSWLAEPAPMRSLNFVSPDAPLVFGVVAKEPIEMLDDLSEIASDATGGFMPSELSELQQALGVDFEGDIAASLGGEMAFALDGPMRQPIPWKLVLEVYDSNRLQGAFERLAARDVDGEDVALGSESSGGRTFHTLRLDRFEIHYTYADGFLVAASSRLLVERALQLADSGTGLVISKDFRSMLPPDGETNFSALLYQDTGRLSEVLGQLGIQQIPPTLVFAYGREDSIEAAMVTPGDPLALDWLLRMLFQAGAVQSDLQDILGAPPAASSGPVASSGPIAPRGPIS